MQVLAAGKPVDGAHVRVYPPPVNGTADWPPTGQAGTDETGWARLRLPAERYLVVAEAKGLAVGRRLLTQTARGTTVAIELATPVSLSGRTVQEQGLRPVPLAELTLTPHLAPSRAFQVASAPEAERVFAASDRAGNFRIDGLAPGHYTLEARAAGVGRRVLADVELPLEREFLIRLRGSGFVEGFVRLEDGTPVADAEVQARSSGGFASSVESTSTSASGAFSLEVTTRTTLLLARKGDLAGSLRDLSVAPGETRKGLQLQLRAAAGFSGSVVSREGRTPIASAEVKVTSRFAGEIARALTGAKGRFQIDRLPPGAYDVEARASGYTRENRFSLVALPGQRFPLSFELRGTSALWGTVTEPNGRPVAGAWVRARSLSSFAAELEPTTQTDAEGRYRLQQLEGERITLSVQRSDRSGFIHRTVALKGGEERVDLVLVETGVLEGRVKGPGGKPLEGPAIIAGHELKATVEYGQVSAITRPTGEFRIELPAGDYGLFAMPGDGSRSRSSGGARATVQAGKTVQVDIPMDSPGAANGVVLEPDGRPSIYASLSISVPGSPGELSTGADEQGRFELTALTKGKPARVVARNGGRIGEAVLQGTEAEATVRLRPAGALHGRVVRPDGVVEAFNLSVTSLVPSLPRVIDQSFNFA